LRGTRFCYTENGVKAMEEKYCAFLRGVNVNGTSMKMDALRTAFLEMGFENVKTVLASGNVIFSVPEEGPGEQGLKAYIEEGLSGRFQYDAHLLIRSGQAIREVLDAAQTVRIPDGCHRYILLCDDGALLSGLQPLFDGMPHTADERLAVHPFGAFWIVPKGRTLGSDFGAKVLGSKKYKSVLTSRNMNTLEKIHKAMTNPK
jgi:uncharacterized protein (DUF1697 family)